MADGRGPDRIKVAGSVIAAVLDRPDLSEADAHAAIEQIIRRWRVSVADRERAYTFAYVDHLLPPEDDQPHNVMARQLLTRLGANTAKARQEA